MRSLLRSPSFSRDATASLVSGSGPLSRFADDASASCGDDASATVDASGGPVIGEEAGSEMRASLLEQVRVCVAANNENDGRRAAIAPDRGVS